MTTGIVLWGVIAVTAGVFMGVYGYTLFRVVLLCMGFLIGFSIVMSLTSAQPDGIRIIVSLVAGGILGGILYFLFSLSLYIAGSILGLVIASLIASLLRMDGTLQFITSAVGLGLGAFVGRVLDELIIILATSGVGAYAVVYGLTLLFPSQFGTPATSNPGMIPINTTTLVLLVVIVAISGLAQYQILMLRRRIRN